MESPYLPEYLFRDDFSTVYEPSEDTYLLLDALEKDLESLKKRVFMCIECGSGSGTVITALSKSLCDQRSPVPRLMIATDINPNACRTTLKCANHHKQNNIHVINTDLAQGLVDRLENKVDLLVFNPPYVPTSQGEIHDGSEKPIYLSWAGGHSGRVIVDRFLKSFVPRLLSKPDGTAYLVALEQNNIPQLQTALKHLGITGSISLERKAGTEHLYVIKYNWDS